MDDSLLLLARRMIAFNSGDPKRILHLLEVHDFAKLISEGEGLEPDIQFVVETAALVHDIGIRPAEEKYGYCDGKLQEREGPSYARTLLSELSFPRQVIERVCFLVAHHHTYNQVDGLDYRILLEADALVNITGDNLSPKAAATLRKAVFRTRTGLELCETLYGNWNLNEGL